MFDIILSYLPHIAAFFGGLSLPHILSGISSLFTKAMGGVRKAAARQMAKLAAEAAAAASPAPAAPVAPPAPPAA